MSLDFFLRVRHELASLHKSGFCVKVDMPWQCKNHGFEFQKIPSYIIQFNISV